MKKITLLFLITLSFILVACGNKELNIPTNIRLEDNYIVFNVVSGATKYIIEINDKEELINTNKYELTAYGTYNVRVKALDDKNNESLFTSKVEIKYEKEANEEEKPYILDSDQKIYLSGSDLIINFHLPLEYSIKSLTAPSNDITNDEYSINGSVVTLRNSFLKRKFEEERNELILAFVVSNNQTQHIINVFITRDIPKIINNLITFQEDSNYNFEVTSNNWDIVSVNGNSITSSDYEIDNDKINIKAAFVNNAFLNIDRQNLILAVLFKKGNNSYTTFITISR